MPKKSRRLDERHRLDCCPGSRRGSRSSPLRRVRFAASWARSPATMIGTLMPHRTQPAMTFTMSPSTLQIRYRDSVIFCATALENPERPCRLAKMSSVRDGLRRSGHGSTLMGWGMGESPSGSATVTARPLLHQLSRIAPRQGSRGRAELTHHGRNWTARERDTCQPRSKPP